MIRAIRQALNLWQKPIRLGSSSLRPAVFVRGKKIFTSWSENGDVLLCETRNGLSTKEVIGNGYYPDLTNNGSNHVVWESKSESTKYSVLYYKSGKSINISGDLPYAELPRICSFGVNLFVVFQSKTQTACDIYFVRSYDNGGTWSIPIRIGAGSRPSIDISNGVMTVVWAKNSPYGIVSRKYNIELDIFYDEVKVAEKGNKEQTPDVCGGIVVYTKYTDFNSYFTDGKFSYKVAPSLTYTMHPRVCFAENKYMAVFQGKRTQQDSWNIYLSSYDGINVSSITTISGNVTQEQTPSIHASDKLVAIVYSDSDGTYMIERKVKHDNTTTFE